MALPSAIKLFINPRTGLAFGNFNGTSQITNPTVTLGDTARFEIYLVEDTGLSTYPRQEIQFPGSPGIRVAVGPIDESPLAGTWTVSFGGNTTSALPYNVTAAALAAALNGLASITAAGGVTVSKIGDNYNIVFNQNGARGDITTNGAALIPLSAATVAILQIGDANRPQIALVHLQRTIAGLATSFSPTAASAITIESLAAWNGSRANYRASISPDPKGGSFTLAFDAATGTDVSSPAIAVGASAIDVQNALNVGALTDKVSVTQVGAYSYDITVTAEPGASGLTASGAGLISLSGYVGELSLNTAEAISLLDGAAEVQTTLEVEITSDSKTLTILQIPCTLQNAVIDAGAVQPLVLDTYLSQNVADGRYARQANNLSDLADIATARTNLGVYSTSSVDSALALKANLAGATFSGNIIRNNGLGQTIIGPASVSFSQTGGGGSFVTYGSTSITFADNTVQTTAFTGTASTAWGTISGSLANQTDLSNALAGKAASVHTHIIGNVTGLQGALDAKANLAGATFTGKINLATGLGIQSPTLNLGPQVDSLATNATAGDIWISTASAPKISYKVGLNNYYCSTSNLTNTFSAAQIIDTTASSPALRITQKGAGSALVVEDSVTPDSDALIVDANGNLGIGVSNNPGSIWTGSAYKLEVNGAAYVAGTSTFAGDVMVVASGGIGSTSINFTSSFYVAQQTLSGIGTQSNPNTSGNFSSGDYPNEIVLRIGGNVYAVPARQIV